MSGILERLGFDPGDRVVILHADDLGMCQATLSAFDDLVSTGLEVCGSVMVPCPWFPAAADYFRRHPELDVGVHLTLTSEWPSYRWRPLSTGDPRTGLVDEDGYFHRTRAALHERADPAAVEREMRAQVERALAAGLAPTHVDSHMYTAFSPRLLARYVRVGLDHGLPPFLWRPDLQPWFEPADGTAALAAELRRQGALMVDRMLVMPSCAEEGVEKAKRVFDDLPPGLTHLLFHPVQDTPETRAILSDWPRWTADFQVFLDPGLHRHIHNQGIRLIGYRRLQEALRRGDRAGMPGAGEAAP